MTLSTVFRLYDVFRLHITDCHVNVQLFGFVLVVFESFERKDFLPLATFALSLATVVVVVMVEALLAEGITNLVFLQVSLLAILIFVALFVTRPANQLVTVLKENVGETMIANPVHFLLVVVVVKFFLMVN